MKQKAVITGLFLIVMLISANAHGTQYELSFAGHITTVDDGTLFSPSTPHWSEYASVGDQFIGTLLFSDIQVLAPWGGEYIYPWEYTIDVNGIIIFGYNNPPGEPSIWFYDDGRIWLSDEMPYVSVPVPTDILGMSILPNDSGNFIVNFPYNGGRLEGSFDQVNKRQVPEPSTVFLLAAGLAGLGFVRKRFKG